MNLLKDLFPSLTPIIGFISCIGATIVALLGGWDNIIIILIIFMIIDYITGLSAAYIMSNVYLDSRKGFKGIIKKIVILCLVILAHQMDVLIGQDALIKNVVLLFFIGNEGLSILENASNCGLPVPKKLKDTLAQFTEIKAKK